ncbi:MAG TPA: hypothetical protein VLB44_10170 [Kofleriaceae bacterium]|nr:hypothetical protein [Kofleriaceae bacterium]
MEFDWLAWDADGFVALFSSAGFGPVPEKLPAMVDAIDAALERMKALPLTGDETAEPDEWLAAAQRGFFAFDWAHGHDRYELEALPKRTLRIDEIHDEAIRELVSRVRIPIRFSLLRWVDWDDAGKLSSGSEP